MAGQTLVGTFFAAVLLSIIGYFASPFLIGLMGAEKVVFDNAVLRGQRNRSRKQTTEGRRQGKLTKTMKSVTAWETRNPLEVKH